MSQVISHRTWVRGKDEDVSEGAESKLNLQITNTIEKWHVYESSYM